MAERLGASDREHGSATRVSNTSGQPYANDRRLRRLEACLQAQPSIQACAVVSRRDGTGAERLMAYVVPSGAVAPEAWDAELAAQLPGRPRPAAYVPVTTLPLDERG